jgi:hypothetical protein
MKKIILLGWRSYISLSNALFMKNIFLLFAILFVFLFYTGCKKSSPAKVLPPITQTGANTFACKINGQVWVPYYHCDSYCMGCVELDYNIHPVYSISMFPLRLSLQAGKSENPYSGIFSIGPASLRGLTMEDLSYIYKVGNVFDSLGIDFITNSGYYTPQYDNPDNIFQITKLDTTNKIISGIFGFTLYTSPTDSIIVTDGRFDLKMDLYSRCSH